MFRFASINGAKRSASLTLLAGLAISLFSGIVLASAPSQASGAPNFVVSPADRLRDGQVVRATWSGFEAGAPVYLRQCALSAPTQTHCGKLQVETTDSSGGGISLFPVQSTEGTGHGIAGAPDLRCGVGFECKIVISTDSDYEIPDNGLSVALSFALEASICPQDGQQVITGGGTGGVLIALPDWQTAVCQDPDRITIDYIRTKGDTMGRQDFLCGLGDFAVTEVAGEPGAVCPMTKQPRAHVFAPATNSALVVAYAMRDAATGQRITDLKLTPDMLTWALTAQTMNWTGTNVTDLKSRQIAALNSTHVLPSNILVTGRADSSALNILLTRFMLERAPDAMAQAQSPFDFTEPTEYFPSYPGANDLKSNADAVALAIKNFDEIYGQSGMLAVVDAATAEYYSLPTVAIENAQGTAFVSATEDSISRGVKAMKYDSNGTAVADTSPSDPYAYPMVFTAYAQVPTELSSEETVTSLKTWLTFLASDKAKEDTLPGYVPLTDSQRTRLIAAADGIKVAATPTESPTPTPTPSETQESGTDTGIDSGIDYPSIDSGFGTDDTGIDFIDPGFTVDDTIDSVIPVDSGQGSGQVVPSTSIFAMAAKSKSALPGATFPALVLIGISLSAAGLWNLLWSKSAQ